MICLQPFRSCNLSRFQVMSSLVSPEVETHGASPSSSKAIHMKHDDIVTRGAVLYSLTSSNGCTNELSPNNNDDDPPKELLCPLQRCRQTPAEASKMLSISTAKRHP
mmetsp:Transcript_27776/g.41002  ORF Transcript_27776/g.41002 Transcript_27776/m.41002 type:complete len:107 (-) Transcript_27776:141-461(-)